MESLIRSILTVIASVLASSGFWAYIQKKNDYKDARSRMLLGLGHSQIMELGMRYIDRGYITQDEYENFHTYLYEPYEEMGGNGSAKKIMQEVNKLPMYSSTCNRNCKEC